MVWRFCEAAFSATSLARKAHVRDVQQAVQDIELEDFLEGVDAPVQNHLAEAGQFLVLIEVGFERGQKFPGFHQGVVFQLEVGLEQTVFDLSIIKKSF